eukprot:2100053-Rhodomonas_salina.1
MSCGALKASGGRAGVRLHSGMPGWRLRCAACEARCLLMGWAWGVDHGMLRSEEGYGEDGMWSTEQSMELKTCGGGRGWGVREPERRVCADRMVLSRVVLSRAVRAGAGRTPPSRLPPSTSPSPSPRSLSPSAAPHSTLAALLPHRIAHEGNSLHRRPRARCRRLCRQGPPDPAPPYPRPARPHSARSSRHALLETPRTALDCTASARAVTGGRKPQCRRTDLGREATTHKRGQWEGMGAEKKGDAGAGDGGGGASDDHSPCPPPPLRRSPPPLSPLHCDALSLRQGRRGMCVQGVGDVRGMCVQGVGDVRCPSTDTSSLHPSVSPFYPPSLRRSFGLRSLSRSLALVRARGRGGQASWSTSRFSPLLLLSPAPPPLPSSSSLSRSCPPMTQIKD